MSRILIIEDEDSIADLEKDYLELSGFKVEIEHDGTIGLNRALTEDFDMSLFGFGYLDEDDEDARRTPMEQKLDSSEELDLEDFEDETFSCECPSCGFRFND